MNYYSYTRGNVPIIDALNGIQSVAKANPVIEPLVETGGALLNFKPEGNLFNIAFTANKRKFKGGAVNSKRQDNIRFIM